MGEFLGLLAGIGMFLLIGLLMGRFLVDMGWMRGETGRMLLRVAGMTLGVGAAYWMFGALMHVTLFGSLSSAAALDQIFCGPMMQEMFSALKNPCWTGPASGLIAYGGHTLGTLLFGQYALGGMALTVLTTGAAVGLLHAGLSPVWGAENAEKTVFLLLCLPGAVFLFLPGGAPVILLLAALAFLLGSRWLRPREAVPAPARFFSSPAYDALLCLCAFFSALTTACAALGRIG